MRSSHATLLLIATHVGLLLVFDLAARPWITTALLAVGFTALAGVALGGGRQPGVLDVMVVATLLRVLLMPLPPTLSDDVLRYLWDGKVVANGLNPYALAPEAEELSELRDERWQRMPHREVKAVYPPLALVLFSIAAALPRSLLAWKLLLVAIELGGCALLLRWATDRGIGTRRLALYAWNPLVTLEIAGMGHVDGVGVALVIATVWALDRGARVSGVLAGGAVLAKLVPVVAVPVWWRRAPDAGRFAAGAAVVIALGLLPVWLSIGGPPPGWVQFGMSWEFNGPVYEPLWRVLDVAGVETAVKGGLDRLKLWTGEHDYWNQFYPHVYPKLLAKGLLALGLAGLLWRIWRSRSASTAELTGRTFGAVVLCSATVYPWYLLWTLPWAAVAGHRAWIALSGLILLSYLPQHAAVPLFPAVFPLIWVPFALLLARGGTWSTR